MSRRWFKGALRRQRVSSLLGHAHAQSITVVPGRAPRDGEGVAVDLDEAWRLMNSALAVAQATGDEAGYLGDIHAALPRIKYKRGDRPVAMLMTGEDGTVRTL